jgi:predicted outer membrane repeat protein
MEHLMTSKPRSFGRRPCRLTIEALEPRTLLSAYTVDSLGDNNQGSGLTGDLRYCITKATSGQDTINFSVTGAIDLNSRLPDLSANLTITGPGAASLTVERNSAGAFSVFTVAAGAKVQISDLTIAKGSADQGGGILNKGSLTLSDCVVKNNTTLASGNNDQGGGIYNAATLTISGTTFSDDSAAGNSSPQGGAIYNSGTLMVNDTTLSGNTALTTFGTGNGGAIYNHGTCTVANGTFTDNSVGVNGGAIFSDKGLSISDSQFSDNTTSGNGFAGGGAIYVQGTLNLLGSYLTGNSSPTGGGVYVSGGNAVIGTSTLVNNTGSGVFTFAGGVTVADSTISKNTGGGISSVNGAVTIRNSTLSDNAAPGTGGGINNQGSLTITDSTISGNSARNGGGIYNSAGSGSVTIMGCTIAFNSATGNGGGIDLETTAQIRNTVIAGNKSAKGPDLFGTFSSQGHNLIQDPSQTNGSISTDLPPGNPMLGTLQNNGGPTSTLALLPGSPAIDAGDNTSAPPTDQRGLPRIVNGTIDIGAFEVQNSGPAVTQLKLDAPPSVTAGVPFNVTVSALDANSNVVSGYTGTVSFGSSDTNSGVVLPPDYAFTASDNGTHMFSVTLFTDGTQMLTVKDKGNGSLTATAAVSVGVGTNRFAITAPPTAVAGVSFDVTVAALGPSDNVNTGYTGTVFLTSLDRYPQPSEYTFTLGDNGTHVFHLSLFTAGAQTILARDMANGAMTGTTTVTVDAANADHFLVTAPSTATSDMPFDVIVTALDPYGNTDTNYHGSVAFTSSDTDPGVVLPGMYTFTTGSGEDNGVHGFLAGVALITPGDQTLTVADTANGSVSGNAAITVTSPAAPPGGAASGPQQVAVLDQLFVLTQLRHKGLAADSFGGELLS